MTAELVHSGHGRAAGVKAKLTRSQLQLLADDLADLYRSTKVERSEIHRRDWKKRGYFLDQVERFTDDIQGYASWVTKPGMKAKVVEARNHLSAMDAQKLLARTAPYPHLRLYVAFHDYLRRVLIDYLGDAR